MRYTAAIGLFLVLSGCHTPAAVPLSPSSPSYVNPDSPLMTYEDEEETESNPPGSPSSLGEWCPKLACIQIFEEKFCALVTCEQAEEIERFQREKDEIDKREADEKHLQDLLDHGIRPI